MKEEDYSKLTRGETNKKFKSPIRSEEFRAYWKRFVFDLSQRPGFDPCQLKNLEILCSLYVEYDRMNQILEKYYETTKSYIVENSGRYGLQIKTHPLFTDRKKILEEIRNYSKLLSVVPFPKKVEDPVDDDDNESWGDEDGEENGQ